MNAVHQGVHPPKGELPVNIIDLEKQVILMEDIQEIENLQKRYGYYFEIGNYQGVVDLFSEDAESVEIESCGLFLGKAGVKKMYVDTIGSNKYESWVRFCIQMMGGVVDVDPDLAMRGYASRRSTKATVASWILRKRVRQGTRKMAV
jgi:hypothetical protein